MNIPNRLTMLRIVLVPITIALLLLPHSVLPWYVAYPIGLLLFVATSLTDMFDGKIARSRGLVTNFGKLMDPLADKIMVIGIMLTLQFRMSHSGSYGLYYKPVFLAVLFFTIVLIVFRELTITSLRSVLASSVGKVLAANKLGKIKTVTQIIAICAMMLEPLGWRLTKVFASDAAWVKISIIRLYSPVSLFFLAITAVLTVWSAAVYIASNWGPVTKDW